jgi:hypothetical protein
MAARLRPRHQEEVKAKIQASQLLNFLQKHALNGKDVVNPTRIDAAKFLLNKLLSNAPTEVSGPDGGPVQIDASWLSGRSV